MKLIDADKLSADMYHEAFAKDSDMQKWDNGCWIRYKMFEDVLKAQPAVQPNTTTNDSIPAKTGKNDGDKTSGDCISRQQAIDAICEHGTDLERRGITVLAVANHKQVTVDLLENLPSAQPDLGKYEYHYDHTDCIWYRPEARNRCPVTCAQYRDGWNDAMNYIFRDGKGYRPYRRGEQYEE